MKNKYKKLNKCSGCHSFDCYLCGSTFNLIGDPCIHFDQNDMNEEPVVSLCDNCADKVIKKAKEENIQGLPESFFNCNNSNLNENNKYVKKYIINI